MVEHSSGKIVIVDDEETNLHLFEAIVRRTGFEPAGTQSPEQAIEWCSRPGDAIPLLILDVQMPGLSGVEIARRVAQLQTSARFLFVSGTPFAQWSEPHFEAVRSLAPGSWCVLPKPFLAQSLMHCLECLLASRNQFPVCSKHGLFESAPPIAMQASSELSI